MIILDTNVVSEFIRPQPHQAVLRWLDGLEREEVFITAMTAAELLSGVARLPPGRRRSELSRKVGRLFDALFSDRILAFDVHAALKFAGVIAIRESAGQPIGVADAIIAATALDADVDFFATRNTKDFEGIGLRLLNPWNLG